MEKKIIFAATIIKTIGKDGKNKEERDGANAAREPLDTARGL